MNRWAIVFRPGGLRGDAMVMAGQDQWCRIDEWDGDRWGHPLGHSVKAQNVVVPTFSLSSRVLRTN